MKVFKSLLAAGTLATALVGAPTAHVQAQVPINGLVSGSTNDAAVGDRGSNSAAMSADGRFVAFDSTSENLVPEATTRLHRQVFLRDTRTRETTLVSIDSAGNAGDSQSRQPSVSGDGRYIAFESLASNLADGSDNGFDDIYIFDRVEGRTSRISIAADSTEPDGRSISPSISADGQIVAFRSDANNLVTDDQNEVPDIFVTNRQTGDTVRVSVSSQGVEATGPSSEPVISANGRFVAFKSRASNLVPNDNNGLSDFTDVFVHDLDTGSTTRVSVSSTGREGDNSSYEPDISADGRFVVFASDSANLVPDDRNDLGDIFVHDTQTGETKRINLSTEGIEADDGDSETPSISADGRFVVFDSEADNLVLNDTNRLYDVFHHDTVTGVTTRLSVGPTGLQSTGDSFIPSMSADGSRVAFESDAPGFSDRDLNRTFDIFIAVAPEPVEPPTPTPTPTPGAVEVCAGRQATVVLAEGEQPTNGDDVIVGTSGADEIRALGGNDIVCGGGGNDVIRGGAGNDKIYGQQGRDRLFGNRGTDEIFGGSGRDVAKGGPGADRINGGGGGDTLRGGGGTDTLVGGRGRDRMFGGSGTDSCLGTPGADAFTSC